MVDYGYDVTDPVAVYAKHSGEMIWVKSDSPYQTLEDLINASKENPGKITLGISMGGAVYAAGIMLQESGAQFSLVDAGDGAERIVSVLGGHVDAAIAGYGIGKEYIESGDLRPLCTLMSSRSAAEPNIPTAIEAGVSNLAVDHLFVILAPKGTDPSIIEKLNTAIMKITEQDQEYGDAIINYSGQEAFAMSVTDTIAQLKTQREKFMALSDLLQ